MSLGKNINNEWITLRSRNAPSPILIFTLMGKTIIFIISSSSLMISEWENDTEDPPKPTLEPFVQQKPEPEPFVQQKTKLEPFPNKRQNSEHFPTNAKTQTISQQKTKLGAFSNKSHDSNHLSKNIVYRKLLIQRHSIKTLRMVSKILHMFVVACTTFPKHQLSPLNQVDDNRIQF